uniref:RAVE complex protein Rav1 C-terminal domain-containing protein n=1 Tax=Hyaloperonospora arabidopsidis (strain Emoy2) TaxID=559515 RepID=M4BH43_HYAAE
MDPAAIDTSEVKKDFSMVVGLHKDGRKMTVWVFSFETTTTDSLFSSVQLLRKSTVAFPGARVLGIACVPLLNTFEVTFACFDADAQLTLWTFADLDNLLEVESAHRVNVGDLMKVFCHAQNSHVALHSTDERSSFKHFSFSSCGRVAILFEDSEGDGRICFLSTIDYLLQGVVELPYEQFGRVLSLKWTPPITAEQVCHLLFVSTTAIGVLKFGSSLPTTTNKWSVAWSSSRFSVRPGKASSLANYPHALLRVESGLAHLNIGHISRLGSSPVQLLSDFPRNQAHYSQPQTEVFPAHHPITLMYLLARGSFKTLGKVLEHVKMKVLEHEEMCYLQMTDDMMLLSLPLLSLCQLLGNSRSAKDNCDERSDTYLRGKESRGTKNVSHFKASAAPARASDLFAISCEAPRRYDAGRSGADCADRLFMPPLSAHDSLENLPTADVKSVLDIDAFSKFFDEHRCSLTFMTTEESDIFLTIVAGVKKILRWERDCSRQKDEAALRFQASLLWQAHPLSGVQRAADGSDVAKQQAANDSTTPMSSHQEIGGLCSEQIAWGALSEFQPELLQECIPEETMSWKEMRRLRLPFWLKSTTKLIQFLEKAAQVEYATNRNPFAVAVFYVLLGKTRLLASLFKMANESRISDLLGNNLSDVRWKNAAIKNAYVLKGKQRYELSAAFFLLGGKVTEAVSVAKKADTTLVLSFLIARVSEKWEFGHDSSGVADLSQTSYTGMVTAVHGLSGPSRTGSVLTTAADSSESKNVSVGFLRTTVYERALQCGDVYMCFLVKYLLGDTSSAIDVLVEPPAVDMRSMFGDCANSCIRSSMYWSAFGKSLLSACDLIRFLRKAIAPVTLALKERVLRLNAIAMVRSQDAGLGIAALLHQRDTASFVQEFCRERAPSSGAATFLGYRERILIAALGGQVDYLYAAFLKLIHKAATVAASSASGTPFDFVDRLDEEIRCIVHRGGDYDLPGVPETSKEHLLYRVRAAVVEMLVHSGRLAALDFVMSRWSQSEGSVPKFASTRPVLDLVVVVVEGLATVASGDLLSTSSDCSRTRKVDQTCFDLLAVATQLLLWLQYYLLKYLEQRTPQANHDFVGLAVAAVHSVIAVCCRYVKNPCCLHRALGLIFSHGAGLSHESKQALDDITEGDVFVRCASIHRSSTAPVKVSGISSLFEQDIPALYQVVHELGLELDEFTAAVKSRRLHHSTPLRGLPTHFSYCPYWELVMMMVAGDMPGHLSKITQKGVAPTTELSSKLVEAWESYSNRLARFASRHVLCDLAKLFYDPFSISDLAASPGASSRGSPRESSSPARSGSPGTPRAFFSDAPEFPALPHDFGRQLLKCECERCPWLLLVELFTDRDEFLHRLYARMDYCCEKIDGEVRWGRLPEPVSQKSASMRYQQPVLLGLEENAVLLPRNTNRTEQVKRRTTSVCTATGVHVQCVHRGENAIKAMCINRAASDDAEISVCGKKGIFRASYMNHGDGNRFQSKEMHACPHNSLRFVSESNLASPPKSRHIADTTQSSNFGSSIRQKLSPSSSLTAYGNSSPSPLRNPMPASPSEPKLVSFKPTALASHPFLPLFVSGNHKGHVHLWSYDRLSALCAFQTKDVVAVSSALA